MFLSRIEGFRSENELAQESTNPQRTRFFRALPYYFGCVVVIVGGFLRVVQAQHPSAMDWLLPALGCWLLFCMWFGKHSRVNERLERTGFLLLIFGPLVAAYVLANGYDEAMSDLSLLRGDHRVIHSTGVVEENAQLLRTTSKGVLILRIPTREVSFLTYQSFKRIDRIGSSQ